MTLQLTAQPKTINIHGIVKDTAIKSIEISHVEDTKLSKWNNVKLDVVNGEFYTLLQIPFATKMIISYGSVEFDKNYIDSDTEILIDKVGKMHITGSSIQEEYENEFLPFFHSNDRVYDSLMSFYKKYGSNFPKTVKDSVKFLREKYGHQRASLLGEYIKLHPDSYIALWDIYYFVSIPSSYIYFDFDKLFDSFSNQIRHQAFINVLKEKIKESTKMQAGQILPKDFFEGYEQIQNNIKNNYKYYLIDFWYSYCGPCIAGFPTLKKIYNQFHNKGFEIVSISIDQQKNKKNYLAAIKKNNLIWSHVWDKEGKVTKKFNINAFPTYILLDKNDRIINNGIRANELEAFLREKL
jgi:thiol-disulfide isomerase/thioredoxin